MQISQATQELRDLPSWAQAALHVGGAVVLTIIVNRIFTGVQHYSQELVRKRGGGVNDSELQKQTATVATTSRRIILLLLWLVALLLVLGAFKFQVAPLLAGAGVAGIAIGLGAQSLLKDMLAGVFLLADGHIRINDIVKINDVKGVVEELSLRTTVLRDENGAVHIISNGLIQQFSNLTRVYSYYVFDIPVEYERDPQEMLELLKAASDELFEEPEFAPLVIEPLDVLGVDRFAEEGVYVKARIKTQPNQQWKVGREINRRLKLRADAAGLRFATARRARNVVRQAED